MKVSQYKVDRIIGMLKNNLVNYQKHQYVGKKSYIFMSK